MSWIEKIKNDFIITCGDGSEYKVYWLNATLAMEWNFAAWEYVEVSGTDVRRKKRKGNRYNIEIIFQGEDHLDTAEAFRTSADNPGQWQVKHPYYGIITVQPTALLFDNTKPNITRITGTIIETITDAPAGITTVSPVDKINSDKDLLDTRSSQSFATQVDTTITDRRDLAANNTAIYNEGKKSLNNTLSAEGYVNAFNTAQAAVNNVVNEPIAAMQQVQNFINYPILFEERVSSRLNTFISQFNKLRQTVATIINRNGKKIYELQGATIVGAMAQSTVTGTTPADYASRTQVTQVIEQLLSAYNGFVEDTDVMQSLNGGNPLSYIPDFDVMYALSNLVGYTLGNLFKIAGNSRQERTIILENDTNPIQLAHRLYGLRADDSTIDELIASNNIGLNELLIIRKGRKITYYI